MRKQIVSMITAGLAFVVTVHAEQVKEESDLSRIEASEKVWADVKEECSGNYSYTKAFSSFAGFGNETTLVVKDGKVVERRYREWNGSTEGETWIEKGEQIGSHTKGANPLTLDELYKQAKAVAAKELAPHDKRYVRFDRRGLLNSCFIMDTRIMDDAPQTGVDISNIELLK